MSQDGVERERAADRGVRSGAGPGAFAALALVAAAGLLAGGCLNDAFSPTHTEGGAGGRLALVVESGRSDVAGTHFLVDTQTGDLWRLEVSGTSPGRWVRVAEGPGDLRALDADTAGGGGSEAEAPERG